MTSETEPVQVEIHLLHPKWIADERAARRYVRSTEFHSLLKWVQVPLFEARGRRAKLVDRARSVAFALSEDLHTILRVALQGAPARFVQPFRYGDPKEIHRDLMALVRVDLDHETEFGERVDPEPFYDGISALIARLHALEDPPPQAA